MRTAGASTSACAGVGSTYGDNALFGFFVEVEHVVTLRRRCVHEKSNAKDVSVQVLTYRWPRHQTLLGTALAIAARYYSSHFLLTAILAKSSSQGRGARFPEGGTLAKWPRA